MRRPSRRTLIALAVPVGLVAVVLVAYGVDRVLAGDEVARSTELGGRPVGGLTPDELLDTVASTAATFESTPVRITSGDAVLEGTAKEVGLDVDGQAAYDAAQEVGRSGSWFLRPVRWVGSLFGPTELDLPLTLDKDRLAEALVRLEGDRRTPAVEPRIEATGDGLRLVPGKDGRALTTAAVAAALPRSVPTAEDPVRVSVRQAVLPPRTTDEDAGRLVIAAQKVTAGDVTLTSAGETIKLPGSEFRPLFSLLPVDGTRGEPELTMDPAAVGRLVASRTGRGANPTGVKFAIAGGVPVPVAGKDAVVCCGPDAPRRIVAALLAGSSTVEVPTRTVTAAEGVEWARGLGVKEVVGQFTTNHPAGQPRVTNIHRMADEVRGVLIPPGETFSINGYVGRRTAEKGYVSAPAIENGEFVQDIGGGVSQFATTAFNAAFFAGLDIPAYKPHSIYISRYPFGREATLAYPGVDLKIRNNSPHGVVLMPSYTASSITVQLWSTRFATGEQTAQNRSSGCGRVVTTRTRTFVDGRPPATDRFYANYDCDPPDS